MLNSHLLLGSLGTPSPQIRAAFLRRWKERDGVTNSNPQSPQRRLFLSQTGSVTHLPKCGRKVVSRNTEKCQSFDGSIEYLHNLAVLDELELIVRPESAGLSDSINPNLSLIMYAIEF